MSVHRDCDIVGVLFELCTYEKRDQNNACMMGELIFSTKRIESNLNGLEYGANFVRIIFHMIEYFDRLQNPSNFPVDCRL